VWLGRLGRVLVGQVAEQADAEVSGVVAADVAGGDQARVGAGRHGTVEDWDGVGAGPTTFVDPTLLVDEEVVADVTPGLRDALVVVDGPDRARGVGVVVRSRCVVHREGLG
jgi:hypothetical protein